MDLLTKHKKNMISQKTLDAINNLDFKQAIAKYITLTQSTGGNWKGLCPFHNDSNASFTVSVPKEIATCFVCNKSYKSVIKFVEDKKRISFSDAVHEIAADNNIIVEYDKKDVPEGQVKKAPPRKELLQLLVEAQTKFIENLNNSQAAKDYLATRHFRPETLEYFEVGFAKGNEFAKGDEQRLKDLEAVYLITKKEDGNYRDVYFNRITIPFHNQSGKIIGFQGRVIEKDVQPKYINPTNTDFYNKSTFLYNYHRVAKQKPEDIWLVESVTNAWRLHEMGITNVVATCGTALTPEQANKLISLSKNVILCYDNDSHKSNAGAKATMKAIEMLLPLNANIKIYEIPTAGEDIDSYGLQLKKDVHNYIKHLILGSGEFNNKPYFAINYTTAKPLFLQGYSEIMS